MKLKKALRYKKNESIAFVGAGGKTTAMFILAKELNSPVIVSASTHLMQSQINLADNHITVKDKREVKEKLRMIKDEVVLITSDHYTDQRVSGLESNTMDELFEKTRLKKIPMLIEADGSRRKPIKAPETHEPPIPKQIDIVIVSVGLTALGKIIDEKSVHRVDKFMQIVEKDKGELIDNKDVVRLLTNKDGGLKNIPKQSKRVVLLNQADNEYLTNQAKAIADELIMVFDTVLISSFRDHVIEKSDSIVKYGYEKTAGIILAAGEASRFGEPKQLINWKGKPLILHTAEIALNAGLDPVIVVIGAVRREIKKVLQELPVKIVTNELWKKGQSTSLRIGIESINRYVGAAVVLLADQPCISEELIRNLLSKHRTDYDRIIAPFVNGQRTNPVLFDREMFKELTIIKGDVGARELIRNSEITKLFWNDENLLNDIDTLDDYKRLLNI